MKKILAVILIAVMCNSLGACGYKSTEEQFTNEQFITGDWTTEAVDDETLHEMEDAFIAYWRESSNATVGDEVIKDIIVFKPSEDSDFPNHYYCLLYGSVHLKETYRNDGSMYYKISDNPADELKDVYYDGTLVLKEDKWGYTGIMPDIYDTNESAMDKLTNHMYYSNMVSVLTDEQRKAFVNRISNYSGDIYEEMSALLKAGNIEDARNLYYKTTDIAYQQSKRCLILYALYSQLEVIKSTGINVTDVTLDSYADSESDNEDDVVLFIKYHYTTAYSSTSQFDIKEIHITLDVENKTYTVRE